MATSPLASAGAPSQGQSVMEKVMDILRKMGLDGPNAGMNGALSKDDLKRLMESLKQLGPEAIKTVLQQNPNFTQTLSQAMAV